MTNPLAQFAPFRLGPLTINPPLLLAPMAGITHSAFRRLLADFGGYGAVYTEMLSATALLGENVTASPFTRRRPQEGTVIYQLRLTGQEEIERAIERLAPVAPSAIDINCGCPAPMVARSGGGSGLFADLDRLGSVVQRVRDCWKGPLLAKFRLGGTGSNWEEPLCQRLSLFEHIGVDALVVHPRFSDEKLKRAVRWDAYRWVRQRTKLPIVANGDIGSVASLEQHREQLDCVNGIMIGRMAVVKPWLFSELCGLSPQIDYLEVWERFVSYTREDFIAGKALGRIKEFGAYYARNFLFGHQFYAAVQGAPDLDSLLNGARKFLEGNPALCREISVAGI